MRRCAASGLLSLGLDPGLTARFPLNRRRRVTQLLECGGRKGLPPRRDGSKAPLLLATLEAEPTRGERLVDRRHVDLRPKMSVAGGGGWRVFTRRLHGRWSDIPDGPRSASGINELAVRHCANYPLDKGVEHQPEQIRAECEPGHQAGFTERGVILRTFTQ